MLNPHYKTHTLQLGPNSLLLPILFLSYFLELQVPFLQVYKTQNPNAITAYNHMASTCISNCITDTRIRLRPRPAYVNLNKWPESIVEFAQPGFSNAHPGVHYAQSRIVDTISCRQMYLRSYTFSRKESVPEKTKKYFGKVKDRVKNRRSINRSKACNGNNRGFGIRRKYYLRRVKEVSCDALLSMFRRLLFCTAKVDVADHRD